MFVAFIFPLSFPVVNCTGKKMATKNFIGKGELEVMKTLGTSGDFWFVHVS